MLRALGACVDRRIADAILARARRRFGMNTRGERACSRLARPDLATAEHGTGPAVKPVTQASRLVAHNAPSVASGLGVRIPAAGPADFDATPVLAIVTSVSHTVSDAVNPQPLLTLVVELEGACLIQHACRACPHGDS